ncbi:MAG: hypothetical protein P4L49_09195 [Desulfosporosinus sp.]|nr:hypothetical protein [Desulfosporosinus sp.]
MMEVFVSEQYVSTECAALAEELLLKCVIRQIINLPGIDTWSIPGKNFLTTL